MKDFIDILPSTGAAIDNMDVFGVVQDRSIPTERAAWIVLVLRQLPDTERYFPHGKWGTIQSIEQQLEAEARAQAAEIAP